MKRAAASIVVAARNAGLTNKDAKKAVQMAMRIYRLKVNEYAKRSYLDTWYSRVEADVFLKMVEKKHRKTTSIQLARVRDKDRLAAFSKLTEVVDLERRIIHNPPLIYRLDKSEEDIRQAIIELFTAYGASLEDSRKRLLSRYRFVDLAHKVVGVGSVGTRCFISLWIGLAGKLTYADSLPTIGSLDYWVKLITGQVAFDYKEVFERLELTKTTHWAHEKEWRVISFEKHSDQLYSDYQIHPRTFSKVFFGANISDQDRADICGLVGYDLAHMELFDMKLNYNRRQINFEKVRRAT